MRFPNEIKAVKDAGGIVIRVTRGPEPSWYSVALAANSYPQPNVSTEILNELGIHPSEWAWVGTKFDAVIDNNSPGLDNLYRQVKNLVEDLQQPKADQS